MLLKSNVQFVFGSDFKKFILDLTEEKLLLTQNTNCGKLMNIFTTALKRNIYAHVV